MNQRGKEIAEELAAKWRMKTRRYKDSFERQKEILMKERKAKDQKIEKRDKKIAELKKENKELRMKLNAQEHDADSRL
eukprot:UN23326